MPKSWSEFVRSEKGASSVEYGLLISGIALAIFGSVMLVGQTVMEKLYAPAQDLIK